MTEYEETPEQKAAWKAFLESPECDAMLEEALNDPEPPINLSEPGVIEKLRKEFKLKKK